MLRRGVVLGVLIAVLAVVGSGNASAEPAAAWRLPGEALRSSFAGWLYCHRPASTGEANRIACAGPFADFGNGWLLYGDRSSVQNQPRIAMWAGGGAVDFGGTPDPVGSLVACGAMYHGQTMTRLSDDYVALPLGLGTALAAGPWADGRSEGWQAPHNTGGTQYNNVHGLWVWIEWTKTVEAFAWGTAEHVALCDALRTDGLTAPAAAPAEGGADGSGAQDWFDEHDDPFEGPGEFEVGEGIGDTDDFDATPFQPAESLRIEWEDVPETTGDYTATERAGASAGEVLLAEASGTATVRAPATSRADIYTCQNTAGVVRLTHPAYSTQDVPIPGGCPVRIASFDASFGGGATEVAIVAEWVSGEVALDFTAIYSMAVFDDDEEGCGWYDLLCHLRRAFIPRGHVISNEVNELYEAVSGSHPIGPVISVVQTFRETLACIGRGVSHPVPTGSGCGDPSTFGYGCGALPSGGFFYESYCQKGFRVFVALPGDATVDMRIPPPITEPGQAQAAQTVRQVLTVLFIVGFAFLGWELASWAMSKGGKSPRGAG